MGQAVFRAMLDAASVTRDRRGTTQGVGRGEDNGRTRHGRLGRGEPRAGWRGAQVADPSESVGHESESTSSGSGSYGSGSYGSEGRGAFEGLDDLIGRDSNPGGDAPAAVTSAAPEATDRTDGIRTHVGSEASHEPGKTRRQPRLLTYPLVVLALVNFVDHVDMAILRGVLPLVGDHFSLNDRQLGLLGFAFVIVNIFASIPAGWMADNLNRARLIGYTLMSWSGLSALSAAAFNYASLLGARAIMGFGQAIDDPASTSLIGDYFPPHTRGRVFSVQQVSMFVGSAVGLALAGFVGSTFGWRWAFVIVGMPGSLVALGAFRLKEPRRGQADLVAVGDPAATSEASGGEDADLGTGAAGDRSRVSEDPGVPSGRSGGTRDRSGARIQGEPLVSFLGRASSELFHEIVALLRIRTMRYILTGAATLLFTVQGIGYWLAVFHQRYSGMSLPRATAVTAGTLGLAGIIGTFWGGSLADRLLSRRGYKARIDLAVGMILVGATLFLFSWIVNVVSVRLLLQFVGMILISTVPPTLRASTMDVVPAQSRGVGTSAFAVVTAVFGTAAAPAVVGWLSDLTSLRTAFLLVSPPIVAGTLILWRARFTISDDAQKMLLALVRTRRPQGSLGSE